MAITVDSYYQSRRALNDMDETRRNVIELIGELCFKAPAVNTRKLSYKDFVDYIVMSAVETICYSLKKNKVSFVPTLLTYYDKLVHDGASSNNMTFTSFYVNTSYERAVIFGCVYYILSFDNAFTEDHLQKIEALFSGSDMLYFRFIKDAAVKDKAKKTKVTINPKSIVDKNLEASDGKRIVLADRRNSDFTRIVQAMITAGYFRHADKSAVTATEVGEMMLKLVGVGTEWKSMLQKAFSRNDPLKTFDNLKDSAHEYWVERAHLND